MKEDNTAEIDSFPTATNKTKKETKKMKDLRPQDINDKPWYKKAALPWMIIYTIALIGGGIIAGSIITHNQDDLVRAEASSMVNSLSKPKQ